MARLREFEEYKSQGKGVDCGGVSIQGLTNYWFLQCVLLMHMLFLLNTDPFNYFLRATGLK